MTMSGPELAQRPSPPATAGLVAVDGRSFPLRTAAIRATAGGGIARTVFTQSYANPYFEPLEVLYTLPLPADGAVVGYTIHLGEKVITGQIEKRETAAKMYAGALAAGRMAGLLSAERADTFTQKLGNLPPGAEVRVEIEVLHPLAFLPAVANPPATDALWQYRFPTVVGVRYEGAPGRVPDASLFDVERADPHGTPVRLDLELLVEDGEPSLLAPRSTSHALATAAAARAATRVTLDAPARLDRDLVVEWRAGSGAGAPEQVGVRLVEGPGLPGDDGRYGLLTITPPARPGRTFARDLTLLIDASGSMDGAPLAAAKALAQRLLADLGPEDRFELLAFASRMEKLVSGPVSANERNRRRAREKLAALRAGGGTEMASAIAEALAPLRGDSQRQVVLLSDGYIGFEGEVVGQVLSRLPAGARLHAVGIGSAPNRSLTQAAARAGRGIELLVGGEDEVERAATRLRAALVGPLLTDLEISGSAVRASAPGRPRDVLAGAPLVLAIELAPGGGSLAVSGRTAGATGRWTEQIAVLAAAATAAEHCAVTRMPVGALHGREAIADEELHLAVIEGHLEASATLDRIEALGLRHRIASRRTSLIAIAEEPSVDPRAPRRRERLPVELPAGVSAEGVGLGGPMVRERGLGVAFHAGPDMVRMLRGARGRDLFAGTDLRAVVAVPLEIEARVTCREGDLLVLEFESPADGFLLPGDRDTVRVVLDDRSVIETRVDAGLSTRTGPHARGLTLRLALRTAGGETWPSAPIVAITWNQERLAVHITAEP
jgi:Ca-activated chloride channel family protein